MSYAFLLLNFNRQIRGHRRREKHFIMKLKTVALIALIASVLMLLFNICTLIVDFGYGFRYYLRCIADTLFIGSLGVFFYILYKKL